MKTTANQPTAHEVIHSDGYKITFTGEHGEYCQITNQSGKKSLLLSSCNFVVQVPDAVAKKIAEKGANPQDYLWNERSQIPLRATLGVREHVAAVKEAMDAEQAKREAEWKRRNEEAEAAALAKCTLVDPVRVQGDYYDGSIWGVKVDGTRLDHGTYDWSDVQDCGGGYLFMAREARDKAVAATKAARDAKVAAEAAKKEAEAQRIDTLTSQARETGKSVVVAKWLTDRCMCGNEDCSFDNATQFVLPDGSFKTSYSCCY